MPNLFARKLRLVAAALSLALVASACGGSTTTDEASSSPADAGASDGLPQLVGDTVAGGQIDTNDLAGQDVVVWFWAPW